VATPRDGGSVQPLVPASRRASQHQRDTLAGTPTGTPHPYATAPSPTPYRSAAGTDYGRRSPNPPPHMQTMNGSESFLYAQTKPGADGVNGPQNTGPQSRTMNMYEREQMDRVREQDDDGGHGRRRGFLAALCCRA